jgi:hypothetical protein
LTTLQHFLTSKFFVLLLYRYVPKFTFRDGLIIWVSDHLYKSFNCLLIAHILIDIFSSLLPNFCTFFVEEEYVAIIITAWSAKTFVQLHDYQQLYSNDIRKIFTKSLFVFATAEPFYGRILFHCCCCSCFFFLRSMKLAFNRSNQLVPFSENKKKTARIIIAQPCIARIVEVVPWLCFFVA